MAWAILPKNHKEFCMKLKSLLLTLALVLALSGSALAAKATVHFFVVPAGIPTEQLAEFNKFLLHSAGGFTVSRSTGAAASASGHEYAPENLSYTVSGPRNVARQIKAYLKRNCGQQDVFMLTWPAERVE
jgi:hypothetical protein